jgi:hypothetical protein
MLKLKGAKADFNIPDCQLSPPPISAFQLFSVSAFASAFCFPNF